MKAVEKSSSICLPLMGGRIRAQVATHHNTRNSNNGACELRMKNPATFQKPKGGAPIPMLTYLNG